MMAGEEGGASGGHMGFKGLHPAVRTWFAETLGTPTRPQAEGWPPIARGEHTLILAPTGSGKTLAAFLQCLNSLYLRAASGEDLERPAGVQVVYISPLKALNNDIHRNLEVPLEGIAAAAARLGLELPRLRSMVRTGDTPPEERRGMLRHPPHILITTPESLFLLLSSRARSVLRSARTVIVDEIHALFPNKRGAHLALALEQLADLTGGRLQRVGLSATIRPVEEVAAYLGGGQAGPGGGWQPRPVTVVDAGGGKPLDLEVTVPVPDMRELPEHSVWPEIYRQVWQLAQEHRSTLVFVNSRQVAERLGTALNDLAGEDFCRVHHASVSREVRLETERSLKAGRLRCLVATSSLELGIDIGTIDLVVQVESPHEVARGLQRVGRAGHVPGQPSKGRMLVKTRQDLLEAAVVARGMLAGAIERFPAQENALDVLAQFVVGLSADGDRSADAIYALARGCYNYRALPRGPFDDVLAMLSGRHDTGEYLGLRPLVYWDGAGGPVTATERGRRLVYTSGGTIPDRGLFGVHLQGSGLRLGELDEEFVYERRLGDRFTLGTSAWRIVELKSDRVVVVPATGGTRPPFWRGEWMSRPYQLGRAMADFLDAAEDALAREHGGGQHGGGDHGGGVGGGSGVGGGGPVGGRKPDPFWRRLTGEAALTPDAVQNLRQLLTSQRAATGSLPSRRTLVVEEFRDELGQWRVALHLPYGRRVNEPLAMLLGEEIARQHGREADVVTFDDGILFGWTASEHPPHIDPGAIDPSDLVGRVARLLRAAPLFGLLFREAAARALILPRGAFGRKRTPLWLSRRKAAGLLALAERWPGFPMLSEAYREGLSMYYDLDGLRELIEAAAAGRIETRRVRRDVPSPFARPMVFAATGAYMYENDLPAAERRVRYLGLDREALAELIGGRGLRDLLDPAAIAETTRRASPAVLAEEPPPHPEELYLWLRTYGELPVQGQPDAVAAQAQTLRAAGRAAAVSWLQADGQPVEAWVAAEDLPLYRAVCGGEEGPGQGPEGPEGPEQTFQQALARLAVRFARRHSPFSAQDLAGWYGVRLEAAGSVLAGLEREGRLRGGEFRPGGTGREWSDPDLLEEMHRRSLARARRAVEPQSPADFAAYLQDWQGIAADPERATGGGRGPGPGRQAGDVLSQLAGLPLPAEMWESAVLPLRLAGYQPATLDGLLASGQLRWIAGGSAEDLRVAFWPAELLAPPGEDGGQSPNASTAQGAGPAQAAVPPQSAGPLRDAGQPAGGGEGGAGQTGASGDTVAAAIEQALTARGALFLTGLWQATGAAPGEVLAALERLMVAGRVTNDTLGPVRHLLSLGPRYRSLPRTVTPALLGAMGRWALLPGAGGAPVLAPEQLCDLLLARYGIVTREAASAEGLAWTALLPVLARREMLGRLRRGYFVRGLGGLQYALPEAVEALRRAAAVNREQEPGVVRPCAMPGVDPALAWGRLLEWPEGAYRPRLPAVVVTLAGQPVLAAEGRPLRISPLCPLADEDLHAVLGDLVRVAAMLAPPGGRLEVADYNGRPVLGGPLEGLLEGLGFARGPRTMVRW
ncbi:MAG: DEAD/DEAH box helicase [Bacillota bacterium]|nr:DEAD/DEAH box helicase [Bacillota bacterium]